RVKIEADDARPDPAAGERRGHVAGTAADLEHTAGVWRIPRREGEDQMTARNEPEVIVLDASEDSEAIGMKAGDGVRQRRRGQRDAVLHAGRLAAGVAAPVMRPGRRPLAERIELAATRTHADRGHALRSSSSAMSADVSASDADRIRLSTCARLV